MVWAAGLGRRSLPEVLLFGVAASSAEEVLDEVPCLANEVCYGFVLVCLSEDDEVCHEDREQGGRVVADRGRMRRPPENGAHHAPSGEPHRRNQRQIPVELCSSGQLPDLHQKRCWRRRCWPSGRLIFRPPVDVAAAVSVHAQPGLHKALLLLFLLVLLLFNVPSSVPAGLFDLLLAS